MVETIINYFDSIPPLHRAIILVGGITFFGCWKGQFHYLGLVTTNKTCDSNLSSHLQLS